MIAAAPATTANLGPAFDAAAAALDLWNELELEPAACLDVEISGEGADELPRDETHLSLRAFALFAPVDRYRFSFVNRVPLERGLGSSAAAIALGLVAGAAAAGVAPSALELLDAGEPLEGHADNLAAALLGGVCLCWTRARANLAQAADSVGRFGAARIASGLPATAVVALPAERQSTARSRAALPPSVSHVDAARNAASAALLGAAVAAGDVELLPAAFSDRLHEPYRTADAPLLALVRGADLPGALGATLSGSGPAVVVWARTAAARDVAARLARVLPGDARVLSLAVVDEGARVR